MSLIANFKGAGIVHRAMAAFPQLAQRHFQYLGGVSLLVLAVQQTIGGVAQAQTVVTTTQVANGVPLTLTDPTSFTVTTSGTGTAGYGLWAQNPGGAITADTPVLSVQSANSIAAVAQAGGVITLGGPATPTFDLTSSNLQTVLSTGAGSAVNLTGGTVNLTVANVSASLTAAVSVQSGGGVSLNGTTVTATSARTTGSGSVVGIQVANAGSYANLSNVTINSTITASTSPDMVYGLQVMSGGSVTGSGVTIDATRNSSTGSSLILQATGTGTVVDLSDIHFTGTGTNVSGVSSLQGASVTLNGGTVQSPVSGLASNLTSTTQLTAINVDVSVSGSGAGGASAANSATLTLIGGSVTTTGTGSTAISAGGGGKVNMTGTAVIQAAGATSSTTSNQALSANGANSVITGDGVTVTACQRVGTTCNAAINLTGALAQNGGVVSLTNGSSITLNSNVSGTISVSGVRATGAGSMVSLTDSSVSVAGTNAHGIRADTSGNVMLTNAQVSTTGNGGIGLDIVGAGASVTALAGTVVTTSGSSAPGISLTSGATVSLTNASVTASGATSSALVGSGATYTNVAEFTDSSLVSMQAPAISVTSGTTNVTASNTTISGNGVLLSTSGTGSTTNLTATNGSMLTGAVQTAAGNTSNLTVQSASIWTMSGPSTLTNLTLDAGTLRYGAATTLSVTNPITLGSGGGTIDTNGFSSTLAEPIEGAGALTKVGTGVLTLTGANSYTGGTAINGGVLQVSADNNLGAAMGPLSFDGGTLNTTATFMSARATTLGTGGGTFDVNPGTTLTMGGTIDGTGVLIKTDAGSLVLTADNTYGGVTTISGGTLQLGDGGTSGRIVGDIVDNASLVFNRTDSFILPGAISGTGTVTQLGGGTTILTGDSTYSGGTTIAAGTLQLGNGGTSGSIEGNVLNNGTLAFDRLDTLTFDGEISGSGAVEQIGSGTTVLTGANTYSGATNVNAGTLQAGATNTFSPNSAVTVAAAGTLDLNGFNQTVPSIINAGLINMGVGTPPGTVLTTGSYIGQGGTIAMNTFLEADNSPSDRLVIDGGTASGDSFLRIFNAGGAGALTTGNGILVVDAINGGSTVPGTFALSGPVVAGPYEYTLFRSSVDASGLQNWYLRSTLDCSLEPNAEVCAPPTPPTPPTPPAPPHFRIETSLNAAMPSMALLYGRNLLDTLHERVGDEQDLRGLTGLYQNAPYTGGWARVIGTGGKQDGDPRGVFGSGPEFSYGFLGLQGGQDLIRRENGDGSRDHVGVTFAVGGAHGNVTHFDGTTGNDDLQAYTLGGYWTHFGASGWYVDTMVQGTLYDARTTANRGLLPFKTNGDGLAGSVEAGYPFKFAGGYFIEPQVQLIYQNINFNSAFDNDALVKFSNVDSLIGRIGARFGRTWSLDGNAPDARMITVWIRPNVWQEFRGNPITQFSSEDGFVPFRSDLGGTWGEVNAGVSGQINLNTTLFANVSYQSRFDGKGFAYDGKAGVRINW